MSILIFAFCLNGTGLPVRRNTMSTKIVVENKISAIRKYLTILKRYTKYSRKEIEENIDIRGAVERYLYLAVQAVIDCAEAVISLRSFRKPTALSDTFYILHEEGVLSQEQMKTLIQMSGFRNIIAHDYEKIDYAIVYKVLHEGPKDILTFIKTIKTHCRL